MILPKTNIEEKLKDVSFTDSDADKILHDVYAILNANSINHKRIATTLKSDKRIAENQFNFELLQNTKIFHLNQIKKICIEYRLRFLSTSYFKGELPQEALDKIALLEKEHEIEISGFHIMAPSKLFKLEDKDDPLLFAPIGNDYFYLVHKWGNDLHPLRKVLMWPFKSVGNLIVLLLAISYVATLLIPHHYFSKTSSTAEFWLLFFFTFKSAVAMVIYYGFAMGKNFNPAIWNSKYYNH